MSKLVVVLTVASLALAGCKGKSKDSPTAGSAAGSSGGGGSSGSNGSSGTMSATTEGTGDLKPVTECPPALKDVDRGLARTIPAGCTTVVETEYTVEGTLTIEAGATLRFKPDAALYVGYTAPSKLIVRGTKDKPVTFASAGDQAPGAWRGVHLYSKAARSEIAGLVVEYAQVALDVESPDVTVKDSTFRGSKEVAVRVADDVQLAAFSTNTFDKPGALAMTVPPATLSALDGNVFPADAVLQVRAGRVDASGTWKNPGAPLRIVGEVYIEGKAGKATVDIAAGTTLQFESGAAVYVGYSGDGELKISGTPEAPVSFRSAGEATPGAWRGVVSYSRGTVTVANTVFEHGGEENKGVLRAEGGKVSVTASKFNANVIGVSLDQASELRAFDQNAFTTNKDIAVEVMPKHVGSFGEANTYTDQRIVIHAGKLDKPTTWALQRGARVEIDGEVYVDSGGALTLAAGSRYLFTEAGAMYVGYSGTGTLVAKGTADAAIAFGGVRDEEGTWKGLELSNGSASSVLENVAISNATIGVRVVGAGTASVNGLSCTKCAEAALRWDCTSKVKQTGVKASGGAAKATIAPEGC